jgi:molybdate transport repressor ModE-like protein
MSEGSLLTHVGRAKANLAMQIVPTVAWKIAGKSEELLDLRLLPLLDAIERRSSLAAAVAQCGISYRAGWGLLRDYRQKLGAPLVTLERGRGADLTELGKQILRAHSAASRRIERLRPQLSLEVAPSVQESLDTSETT